jgi:hypothetical protein
MPVVRGRAPRQPFWMCWFSGRRLDRRKDATYLVKEIRLCHAGVVEILRVRSGRQVRSSVRNSYGRSEDVHTFPAR